MSALPLLDRSKIALVRQTEVAECGLACITMIANYYGLKIDLGSMRRRFEPSLRGSSLRTLIDISSQIGLIPRPVKVPLDQLGHLQQPAILHWNLKHFVVLERVTGSKALIHNPDGRSAWMPITQVSEHFTGVALELRPSTSFKQGSEQSRLKLRQLWGRIQGLRGALAQTLLLSALLQALTLAVPYYMQIAVDTALPALDGDLLAVLALGFALLALVTAGGMVLRAYVLLHAGTTVAVGLTTNVVRHLLRLPISWFEKRHSGDILSRVQSIRPIQKLLTESVAATVVDGALTIFTFALMVFYSPILASIALIAFLLQCAVRAITLNSQLEAQEDRIVAAGKEQSVQLETLRGISTIRLYNREPLRHALWHSRLIDVTNADVRLVRLTIWQGTASALIYALENVITVWLAITFVMKGAGFSLGMVFAYMAYKTLFITRVSSLVDEVLQFRLIGLHLSRLADIALSEEDRSFQDTGRYLELKGAIELRDVSYRYAPSDPIVLDKVNFTIERGDYVAITGPSGCGKSTLIKAMLGLIAPAGGEILVDGLTMTQFGIRNFQSQIAAVLQDDHLFAGSLAENIAFFDEHVDMVAVVDAAKAAAIHEDIQAMPMQYETLVGDMGSTLSGGQRQRLLLARALYRKPKILILDEGTSHLDVAHEQMVNAAIAKMGITRIVVAHRKETVDCASRVFVMDAGMVAERRQNANIS